MWSVIQDSQRPSARGLLSIESRCWHVEVKVRSRSFIGSQQKLILTVREKNENRTFHFKVTQTNEKYMICNCIASQQVLSATFMVWIFGNTKKPVYLGHKLQWKLSLRCCSWTHHLWRLAAAHGLYSLRHPVKVQLVYTTVNSDSYEKRPIS